MPEGRRARWWRALYRSNRGRLWAFELAAPVPPPPAPAGYTFRPVAPAEAAELARALDGSASAVARRLAAGQRCFAAWAAEDGIAAYCWVATAPVPIAELEGWAEPGPGEAYIFECATRPAHRGRGLYSALLRQVLAALGRAGLRRAWIGADRANVASQRGIERAGFRPVADVWFVRVLSWRWLAIRPDPSAPASLAAAARRLLRFGDGPTSAAAR